MEQNVSQRLRETITKCKSNIDEQIEDEELRKANEIMAKLILDEIENFENMYLTK